jgi:hypothetical protein
VIRVALRGLAGRKLRAALTALAIVLGVAMMSGAYVLTDTIDKAFDTIFVESSDPPEPNSTMPTILVGILAAILPARRASRLNVLQALQYE